MAELIGLMCIRDEADLLPEVYPHIRNLVDEIYAYDDGSQDDSWKFIKDSDYAIRRIDDKNRLKIPRPNYHHLLEKIKENHDVEKEDVWAIITMGDRFFLNKTPRQIVAEAEGFESVEGVQLDFLRHMSDPWTEENDTFPHYEGGLREICRWAKFDERCIVAFKVTKETSYLRAKYPWPRGMKSVQYSYKSMDGKLSTDMPFLEHQGRRSPKARMWRHEVGSRGISRKRKDIDLSTFESTLESFRNFYLPYRVFPWIDNNSLNSIVYWENQEGFDDRANKRWFFRGMEEVLNSSILFKRKDL